MRRTAIILFKFINFGIGEILFEIKDIADFRTAPAVNALVLVADDEYVAVAFRKLSDKSILNFVGVLKLVNVDISETALIAFQNVGIFVEKFHRVDKQIVKIHCVVVFEFRLIKVKKAQGFFFYLAFPYARFGVLFGIVIKTFYAFDMTVIGVEKFCVFLVIGVRRRLHNAL